MGLTIEESGAFAHRDGRSHVLWLRYDFWSSKDLPPKDGQARGSYAMATLLFAGSCFFQGRLPPDKTFTALLIRL
jgi:hypothetical protein